MSAEYQSGSQDYPEEVNERLDLPTTGSDAHAGDGYDAVVATDRERDETDIDDDLVDIQPETRVPVAPYAQFDPLWNQGKCFHPSDVRALLTRAQQLQQLGVNRADQVVVMGEELYEECREFTTDAESCVSHTGLAELTEFVSKPEHEAALRSMALEYGKARRPIELEGGQEALAQLIDIAAQDTFFSYARSSGLYEHNIRIHPGSCVQGAYILQQRLRTVGVETEVRKYFEAPFFCHFFLKTSVPGIDPLYADATWQQTLPEDADRTALPHTLIAPVPRVTEAAALLGVPDRWQQMWEQTQPCDTDWWKYQSQALNRIMEVDGWWEVAPPMQPSVARVLEAARAQGGDVDLRRLGLDLGSLILRPNSL